MNLPYNPTMLQTSPRRQSNHDQEEAEQKCEEEQELEEEDEEDEEDEENEEVIRLLLFILLE